MKTPWIAGPQLQAALRRNEAFWNGTLTGGPLIWALAPDAKPGTPPVLPPTESEEWTDVDYVMAKAEDSLSRTHYAGDALPVHNPWLGPDQFAAWLGAEFTLQPRENTSWVKPFVRDWADHAELRIDPDNRWWRLYLDILRASAARGRDKWVTCYPDLHTGIDGLAAIRGPEQLMIDMIEQPQTVKRAMRQMTRLWKEVVDAVDAVVLPTGQGTTNWTLGWSSRRFLCLGQNDFSCLVGPLRQHTIRTQLNRNQLVFLVSITDLIGVSPIGTGKAHHNGVRWDIDHGYQFYEVETAGYNGRLALVRRTGSQRCCILVFHHFATSPKIPVTRLINLASVSPSSSYDSTWSS